MREGFEPSFGFGLIPCALLCIVSAERLALNEDYRNKGNSERCLDFARHDEKLTRLNKFAVDEVADLECFSAHKRV